MDIVPTLSKMLEDSSAWTVKGGESYHTEANSTISHTESRRNCKVYQSFKIFSFFCNMFVLSEIIHSILWHKPISTMTTFAVQSYMVYCRCLEHWNFNIFECSYLWTTFAYTNEDSVQNKLLFKNHKLWPHFSYV